MAPLIHSDGGNQATVDWDNRPSYAEVKEKGASLYKEVKDGIDYALFPLFREECKFLKKAEVVNQMVLHQCKHPKNKFVGIMRRGELPNCAMQGCPIYEP